MGQYKTYSAMYQQNVSENTLTSATIPFKTPTFPSLNRISTDNNRTSIKLYIHYTNICEICQYNLDNLLTILKLNKSGNPLLLVNYDKLSKPKQVDPGMKLI